MKTDILVSQYSMLKKRTTLANLNIVREQEECKHGKT